MTVAGGLIHSKAPPDRVLIIASMSRQSDKISSAANQGSRERDMVAIVAALARELHPQRSRFRLAMTTKHEGSVVHVTLRYN